MASLDASNKSARKNIDVGLDAHNWLGSSAMPMAIRSDRTDDLRVQALQFLMDLHDLNMPPDVAIGLLCVLAEQFQPGATVGGSIIDRRSAIFDRLVFPSLPASLVNTLRHMHPLAHRFQRLEAFGRTRGMNADDFRIGVFHRDEDIARPSPMVIVCVMSVPHISLTLSVMIVPSCDLASVCPMRCGASKPFGSIHCSPIYLRMSE